MKTKLISFALGVVCGVALILIWQGRYDYPVKSKMHRYDKWTQSPQVYLHSKGWVDAGSSK